MKLSASTVLPLVITGLLVLPWSCVGSGEGPSVPNNPPPRVITAAAPVKQVKMDDEGRRGHPVDFKVKFTVPDTAYRFSHFEVNSYGNKTYIKVIVKRNAGEMGGQALTDLTQAGSFIPATPGKHTVYFWQGEGKYLAKTVKVKP